MTASTVLHGMVFKKEAEGDVTSVKDAKIAVFSCPFDCMVTETKVMDTSRDHTSHTLVVLSIGADPGADSCPVCSTGNSVDK